MVVRVNNGSSYRSHNRNGLLTGERKVSKTGNLSNNLHEAIQSLENISPTDSGDYFGTSPIYNSRQITLAPRA
jgi:hypothetical protein